MVPIPLNYLATALRLGDRELVAVVGGGGKTTIVFALGTQLRGRVLVTATTKMGPDRVGRFAILADPDEHALRCSLRCGPVVVRGPVHAHKAIGSSEACDRWFADGSLVDHIVVEADEADGANRRPFTAPGVFEPVVPAATTTVLACIGADALGRVIADQCFRPLRVAAVAGCSPNQRLTPVRAASVLLSDRGSRKCVPDRARFVVVITKVEHSNQVLVDELTSAIGSGAEVVAVEYDVGP